MHIYIVIGPSGVGKTTIGRMLSERLNIPYYDADDFHSPANVAKMKQAISLNDSDRLPWLETLAEQIKSWHKNNGAVLACSALKEEYRKKLMSVPVDDITWIYLYADEKLIGERLLSRKGHFFNKDLLKSQFEDMEVPQYGCHINVNQSKEDILDEILICIREDE